MIVSTTRYRSCLLTTIRSGTPTETIKVSDHTGAFVAFVHPAKVRQVIDGWMDAR
jgi:hypothetical protein